MFARLVALDEGPDIILNRTMIVVGRHPACDTRLDFPRVSRHHCCLTLEDGELIVMDLGSTNGIRINGLRGQGRPVEERRRAGDRQPPLSIRVRAAAVALLDGVARVADQAADRLPESVGPDMALGQAGGVGPRAPG